MEFIKENLQGLREANRDRTCPTTIGSLKDAINYYRSKKGGTISGNQSLYDQMMNEDAFKASFDPEHGIIIQGIKEKMIAAVDSGNSVKNDSNSRKAFKCATLGAYSLNIEYDFVPVKGLNNVQLHLFGSDLWDFAEAQCNGDIHQKARTFWRNLTHEVIPKMLAGDGKEYTITYDFNITIPITI